LGARVGSVSVSTPSDPSVSEDEKHALSMFFAIPLMAGDDPAPDWWDGQDVEVWTDRQLDKRDDWFLKQGLRVAKRTTPVPWFNKYLRWQRKSSLR